MTDSEQLDTRRLYLHEAGHAVVGIELGCVISEVVCNGETGYCSADLSPDAGTKLTEAVKLNLDSHLASLATLEQVVAAYFPRFVSIVGGLAGESLVPGRPIYSTRRAADDLSNFYGFLGSMSCHLKAPEFMPIWQVTFERAQDEAWRIVRKRRRDVERLADALQSASRLSGADVAALI